MPPDGREYLDALAKLRRESAQLEPDSAEAKRAEKQRDATVALLRSLATSRPRRRPIIPAPVRPHACPACAARWDSDQRPAWRGDVGERRVYSLTCRVCARETRWQGPPPARRPTVRTAWLVLAVVVAWIYLLGVFTWRD